MHPYESSQSMKKYASLWIITEYEEICYSVLHRYGNVRSQNHGFQYLTNNLLVNRNTLLFKVKHLSKNLLSNCTFIRSAFLCKIWITRSGYAQASSFINTFKLVRTEQHQQSIEHRLSISMIKVHPYILVLYYFFYPKLTKFRWHWNTIYLISHTVLLC